ncbi:MULTISPECIES: hypothetical protein [Actinoplanes]|uniref:hypothetical protein n=1 Tax=Actinoplanes TaxID=1865 RepID=UPI0005F2C232|nr:MULTISPECIES: hypothetical protein [Actinoplanes]
MLVTLVAAGAAVLMPSPASAHPFGDPQTVDIAVDAQHPDVVHVKWRVGGPDDLTLLGVSLGLLPSDRLATDGTVDYRYTDPGVVGASAEFTGYLLQRITVRTGAQECTGAVEPIRALALKGATAAFTCPGPVTTASVAVRTLTDLNPAYRTLATGPSGQRAVYEGGDDTHEWTLTGAPPAESVGRGRSALLQIGGILLAVILVAGTLAGILATAKRRRRAVTA